MFLRVGHGEVLLVGTGATQPPKRNLFPVVPAGQSPSLPVVEGANPNGLAMQ